MSRNLLIVLLTLAGLCRAAPGIDWQRAGEQDLSELFRLAARRPDRAYFTAQIESEKRPLSPEEIEAAFAREVHLKKGGAPMAERREQWWKTFARFASGQRVRHVAQWYFRSYVRSDENDDVLYGAEEIEKAGDKFLQSRVEIYDPFFSPYNRFTIHHTIRSISLDRSPGKRVWPDSLWAVFGLEPELLSPLIGATTEISPQGLLALARAGFHEVGAVPLSALRTARLARGEEPEWTAAVGRAADEGTRYFRLEGTMRVGAGAYRVRAEYECAQRGGRMVLISGRLENETLKTVYESQRTDYDPEGIPHRWAHTLTDGNGQRKATRVLFKTIEANPHFDEKTVFAAPDPKAYPLYTITDVSVVGHPSVIQRPPGRKPKDAITARHYIMASIAALGLMLGGAMVWVARSSKKRP